MRQATSWPPSAALLPNKTPPHPHLLLLNLSSSRTEDETTVHLCHTAREIKQRQALPQKYRHRTAVSQVNRLLIFWNEATSFCKPDYQAFFVKKKCLSPSLYVGERRHFKGILRSGLFAFAIFLTPVYVHVYSQIFSSIKCLNGEARKLRTHFYSSPRNYIISNRT